MEEEFRKLIQECAEDRVSNPLLPDHHTAFAESHGISIDDFYYLFAKFVALDFATGNMSYWDADCAINRIWAASDFGLTGFALEVFESFDSGEFNHRGDPPGTVPWQKYTLPLLMELLSEEGLLSRT